MSKKTIERSLGYGQNLKAAVCSFIDYVCGELDAYLEDENESASSNGNDYYEAICQFGDGSIYELTIGMNDETEEWDCMATRKKAASV